MYGVFLIGVLVAMGGAIAFIGDRLGTKIGKKRLSIFGLRPRHTSIIVTILTGIFITTLTFAIMAAASENVRTALFGMERLQKEMSRTEQELAHATGELLTAKEEQNRTNQALGQSKQEIQELQQQQEDLRQESERLTEGNRALTAANDALASSNASLEAENATLGEKNAALSTQNEHLASEVSTLEQRSAALREGLVTMREGDIAFRAGEVIASGVIPSGRPEEEVSRDLEALAESATNNAADRMGDAIEGKGIWIYQPEFDAAVKTISESPQSMIVRIVAASNLLRGEDVRTSLELYPNRMVFEKDEFILARPYRITKNEDAEQVVVDFLKHVNTAATTKGILPDPIRGSVGVMDGEQFYEVVQAILPIRGNIVLSAYARDDTNALGPLRLNLKLETLQER